MPVIHPCPYDVCECGDYRWQHTGPENRGPCSVCRHGDPATNYTTSCQRFRLHRPAHRWVNQRLVGV